MGYSPRPLAVEGPQKGKKAYENRLSRDLGAPKYISPRPRKPLTRSCLQQLLLYIVPLVSNLMVSWVFLSGVFMAASLKVYKLVNYSKPFNEAELHLVGNSVLKILKTEVEDYEKEIRVFVDSNEVRLFIGLLTLLVFLDTQSVRYTDRF